MVKIIDNLWVCGNCKWLYVYVYVYLKILNIKIYSWFIYRNLNDGELFKLKY